MLGLVDSVSCLADLLVVGSLVSDGDGILSNSFSFGRSISGSSIVVLSAIP